jgi:hypothetical protein
MRFRDADLRAGRRSRPPHPGLVRLHDGVPASAGGPRMVAPGADLGAGPGGEPPPALRARRAPLTAHADSASSATAPRRHPDHAGPKYYRDAKIGKIYRRKGAAGVARVPAHHHPEPGVVRGPRGHGLLGRGLDREDMAVARPARRVEGEAADVGALRGKPAPAWRGWTPSCGARWIPPPTRPGNASSASPPNAGDALLPGRASRQRVRGGRRRGPVIARMGGAGGGRPTAEQHDRQRGGPPQRVWTLHRSNQSTRHGGEPWSHSSDSTRRISTP